MYVGSPTLLVLSKARIGQFGMIGGRPPVLMRRFFLGGVERGTVSFRDTYVGA
jgi:hypothetical protein